MSIIVQYRTIMEDKPTLIYLKEASRASRCFVGKSLQDAGIEDLGPLEAHILFHLMKHEEASSAELRQANGSSKASVSDALNHLVERGYIEYVNSDLDRREKRIVLTPKGLDHQRRVGEIIKKAEETLFQNISSEEEKALRKALSQIIQNTKGGDHV